MNILNIIDKAVMTYSHETSILKFLPANRYNMDVFKTTGQYDWFSGQVLYCLVRYIQPRRILEISTASGYATMFMALALKQNNWGRIDTHEINPKAAQSAEKLFTEHGLNKYINLIVGDARKTSVNSPSDYSIYFLDSVHTEEFARWFIEQHVMRSERIDAIFHMHDILPLNARVRRWNTPPFEGSDLDPSYRIHQTKRFKFQMRNLLHLRTEEIEDTVQIQTYPPENGEDLQTFDGNCTTEAIWGNKLVTMMAKEDYLFLYDVTGSYSLLEPRRYDQNAVGRTDSKGKPMEWNESLWCKVAAVKSAYAKLNKLKNHELLNHGT
jgi:hypothetical protein